MRPLSETVAFRTYAYSFSRRCWRDWHCILRHQLYWNDTVIDVFSSLTSMHIAYWFRFARWASGWRIRSTISPLAPFVMSRSVSKLSYSNCKFDFVWIIFGIAAAVLRTFVSVRFQYAFLFNCKQLTGYPVFGFADQYRATSQTAHFTKTMYVLLRSNCMSWVYQRSIPSW